MKSLERARFLSDQRGKQGSDLCAPWCLWFRPSGRVCLGRWCRPRLTHLQKPQRICAGHVILLWPMYAFDSRGCRWVWILALQVLAGKTTKPCAVATLSARPQQAADYQRQSSLGSSFTRRKILRLRFDRKGRTQRKPVAWTDRRQQRRQLRPAAGEYEGLAFSPDGKFLYFSLSDELRSGFFKIHCWQKIQDYRIPSTPISHSPPTENKSPSCARPMRQMRPQLWS